MQPEQIHQAICKLKFMQELPQELRTRVASLLVNISEARQVPKYSTWIHEHEHTENKGYILLKGEVRIQKADAPLIVCRAPELLGEMMQFNPVHERTASVSAVEDCVVLRFIWDDFWTRVLDDFEKEEQKKIHVALENLVWSHITA